MYGLKLFRGRSQIWAKLREEASFQMNQFVLKTNTNQLWEDLNSPSLERHCLGARRKRALVKQDDTFEFRHYSQHNSRVRGVILTTFIKGADGITSMSSWVKVILTCQVYSWEQWIQFCQVRLAFGAEAVRCTIAESCESAWSGCATKQSLAWLWLRVCLGALPPAGSNPHFLAWLARPMKGRLPAYISQLQRSHTSFPLSSHRIQFYLPFFNFSFSRYPMLFHV